jgi:hypothetical protein
MKRNRASATAFPSDVIRLSRTDLDIMRIAARQCAMVVNTISVAVEGGTEERRHYIARKNEIGRPSDRCPDGDAGWSQLNASHVTLASERRRIEQAIVETAAAGPVMVRTDAKTGVMVVASV